MRHAFIVIAALLLAPLRLQAASPADAACQAAMAPYYAALLTSARGDGDGTVRHLIVLTATWDEVVRRAGADAPPWLRETPGGQPIAAAVSARIEAARRHLPRDAAAAHGELEAIRRLLRDARTTHNARTLDDGVTDYHEAMERLAGRVGESNEVSLSASDFAAIKDDAARARAAWSGVEADLQKAVPASAEVAAATRTLLGQIASAADARDAGTSQRVAHELKARYFDLLALLSRRAG